MAVAGNYAYVADYYIGLRVIEFLGSGVEEAMNGGIATMSVRPTVVRSLPPGAVAFDAMGRRVASPRSGILFIREPSTDGGKPSAVTKVVVQR